MKKTLIISTFVSIFIASCGTSKSPEMKRLEAKKEYLELKTKLNALEIQLVNEENENEALQSEAMKANDNANSRTDKFNDANSASIAAKKAREAERSLRRARKSNRRLANSNKRIYKLRKEIKSLNEKIQNLELGQ